MNTSYHAVPNHSNRQRLYKVVQTLAMSTLILAPLVTGACLYSQIEETDPHVFIISRDGERPSQVSLAILGAVSSFSRMDNSPGMSGDPSHLLLFSAGNLYGPMDANCYITNKSNLTGHILVINITRPKCRILIEVGCTVYSVL